MATKPTKLIQITAPPAADTSRLPVTRASDQRATGLQGTTGTFVSGGVQGTGLPVYVISDPVTANLTADQVIGAQVCFGAVAGANLDINFPSAASIVSYVGADLVRVRPGATPTNGNAIPLSPITDGPRIYEAFDCYIQVFDANSTYTIGTNNTAANPAAAGTYVYGGGFTQNASTINIGAGALRFVHLKVIIANATPGSELVWVIPVGQ